MPGEAIVFSVMIDNRSSREIKSMQVDLNQIIVFHATTKSRRVARHVASVRFPGKVGARNQEHWENIALLVPPVCSSSNGTCRIIDLKYELNLNFDASGVAVSKSLIIPVVIGTVPLSSPMSRPATLSLPASLPDQFGQPPPSYQASIFEPTPNQEMPPDYDTKGELVESDHNSFRPHYPYYKDFSISSS